MGEDLIALILPINLDEIPALHQEFFESAAIFQNGQSLLTFIMNLTRMLQECRTIDFTYSVFHLEKLIMKLKEFLLGALILCNCQLAHSASATSRVNMNAQNSRANLLLTQARKGQPPLGAVRRRLTAKQRPAVASGEETLSAAHSARARLEDATERRLPHLRLPSYAALTLKGTASHKNTPSDNAGSLLFLAQVTPDDTLGDESSTVVPNAEVQGVPAELIEGGAERGANLFHSFEDFNVGEGQSVYFANPEGIVNILSRVTGSDVSDIMGTLGVDGGADLFLINPNGIVFGENASLDVNGSFLSSTADSIVFADGEFNATDINNSLLTINAPIGVNLGANPKAIVNRSTAKDNGNSVGLSVSAGNALSFVGGELRFEGGRATARGGKIELGGLSTAGTVSISDDGSLSFPENAARADITLNDGAAVNVQDTGGGNIVVNARNFNLGDDSFLEAGITAESTSDNAQAGDIEINLTDNLILDQSRIANLVDEGGVGNSGNIRIATGSLTATNGGRINSGTKGQGDTGLVEIIATEDIIFDGANSEGDRSEVTSRVGSDGEGNAGGVNISTNNLSLTDGGQVDSSSSGQGDAGLVEITATGDLSFDGATPEGDRSGVASRVNSGGKGNAGGVNISTNNLTLTNGGEIDSNSSGQGDAGLIEIAATGNLTFDGATPEGDRSGVSSRVNSGGKGNAGGVNISTTNLTLTNGGEINSSSSGQGDAGLVEITATGDLSFDGATPEGDRSGVASRVNSGGEGNARGITISTNNLTLTNGGRVNASTKGKGDAGLVRITATGDLSFDGATPEGDRSEVASRVDSNGEGNAGGVNISTNNLTLTNGGRVNASTKGKGDAGLVDITATGDLSFDGATPEGDRSEVTSRVDSNGEGNAKGVTISTNNLTLTNQGLIDASTSGKGDAGFVKIAATGDLTFDGTNLEGNRTGITSRVNSDGQGNIGNITISTTNLNLANGGRVDTASTGETGDGGSISITTTEDIIMSNNGFISAESSGNNDGGNVNINTRFIIAFPEGNSDNPFMTKPAANFAEDSLLQFGNDILASAEQGQGGNITINARSLFGIEERPLSNSTNDINASSEFGLSGTVQIDILEVDPSRDSLDIAVAPVETEVTQTCESDIDGNQSELTVTGRGGLPDSPETHLSSGFVLEDWRVEETRSRESARSPENLPEKDTKRTEPIVEANSWMIDQQGKVVLVATNDHSQLNNTTKPAVDCSANSKIAP